MSHVAQKPRSVKEPPTAMAVQRAAAKATPIETMPTWLQNVMQLALRLRCAAPYR